MSTIKFLSISFVFLLIINENYGKLAANSKPPPKRDLSGQIIDSAADDDDIFNFLSKLLNTLQSSRQISLKRRRNEIEKRRQFTNEIEDILMDTNRLQGRQ